MLFDAELLAEDNELKHLLFDVCICGGGPAGISLALRLAARGWRVALLEAGGLQNNPASQELYQGEIVGLDYYALDYARLRYLGGSSNHWVGETRPFDWDDFEKSLENYSLRKWPIRKTDLDPYASETDAILDLPRPRQPPDVFKGRNNWLVPAEYRRSVPTRFGEKYQGQLKANSQISLYLNANVRTSVLLSCAPVDVVIPDDIVLVEVGAGLYFDEQSWDLPGLARRCFLPIGM